MPKPNWPHSQEAMRAEKQPRRQEKLKVNMAREGQQGERAGVSSVRQLREFPIPL